MSGRRGMRTLNASDFRDEAHSHGWDFSSFIHAYGIYLDERLDCSFIGSFASRPKQERRYNKSRYDDADTGHYDYSHGSKDAEGQRRLDQSNQCKAIKDMKPEELLENLPILQRLLDRILCCKPAGMAKVDRLVNIALHLVLRESFMLYSDIRDGLVILLDGFFDMDQKECSRVFGIYNRAAKQIDDLISFYSFCKALSICRTNEYPTVEKISEEMLETMEEFLRSRADASNGGRRSKSPESRARNLQIEKSEEVDYEINGIKALPAPQSASGHAPAPNSHVTVPAVQASPVSEDDGKSADLLNMSEPVMTAEEHENKLALALFSDSEPKVNTKWESFSSDGNRSTVSVGTQGVTQSSNNEAAGWELALVEGESGLSNPNGNSLAGGFNNLLLDSLYEQGAYRQKMLSASVPSGSASSIAVPGHTSSNFLALPAPPEASIAISQDPFAPSLTVPPPAYVQMAEIRQKQQLLVQEQQQWLLYQQGMMQGNAGMMKFPNNPYHSSFQSPVYPVPYYGMNPYYR
ncbi:hypothetical protein KP509_34G007000 [Ceratopteris richardii]|nr:hypothetical protein KP509_34G007000 [Ceratopteris richardii]